MVVGGMRAPGQREGSQDWCQDSPEPLGTLLSLPPDIRLKNCSKLYWIHLIPPGECLKHRSAVDPAVDGLPQLSRSHKGVLHLSQAAPTTEPHEQLALQVSVQE